MAFNPDDIRASHTIRIFGTNKNGDVIQDIWLDIERVDVLHTGEQIDGHRQGVYRRLYWHDDPDSDDYDEAGNANRVMGVLKICSPDEEDQEDPEEWIPVRVNASLGWKESTETNQLNTGTGHRTNADNTSRNVAARRIWKRDTIIDDKAQAATDNNQDLKCYVVASDEYDYTDINDTSKEDKDNYIEVQYMSYTQELLNIDSGAGTGNDQGQVLGLRNAFYLNISEEAKDDVNPNHGFNPPWALDPFQAVVNVNFGGLAVEFLTTG